MKMQRRRRNHHFDSMDDAGPDSSLLAGAGGTLAALSLQLAFADDRPIDAVSVGW
jgi:hypothetical protein